MDMPTFSASLQRCRVHQGVGSDGWRCVLLRWAPEWMQRLYLRSLRAVVISENYPEEWRKWFVVMIPKRGRDPTVFSQMRDIWLVPHGWKLVTGCFHNEYARVNALVLPHFAHGARGSRNAAQASVVSRLATEEAAELCLLLVRVNFDLKNFFMSVVRVMLLEL